MKTFSQFIKENRQIEEGILSSIGSGISSGARAVGRGLRKTGEGIITAGKEVAASVKPTMQKIGSKTREAGARYYGRDSRTYTGGKMARDITSSAVRHLINVPGRFFGQGETVQSGRQAAVSQEREKAQERAQMHSDARQIGRTLIMLRRELSKAKTPEEKKTVQNQINQLQQAKGSIISAQNKETLSRFARP